MTVIARQVECPREWTMSRIKELYPDFVVLGDKYGYWVPIEETKTAFISYGWNELVRMVSAHLKGNGIHVPADLNLEMMARFCELTKSPACAPDDPYATERQSFMRKSQRFLRAMDDAVMHGGLVSQEEANRRAALCAQCPKNDKASFSFCLGCSAQTAAAKLAKMTLGWATPLDDKLKVCKICECSLVLKIWCRRETMDEPEFRELWPKDHACWMIPGN